jgi:hypothetical protein
MKNDGEYPLPSKSTGEGGLAESHELPSTRGTNGQGTSGEGRVVAPIYTGGVGGKGKEATPLPRNESGAR